MLIGEILSYKNDGKVYEIKNEMSFTTLALISGAGQEQFCTFVEEDKYIHALDERAVMVITKQKLAEEILNLGKGVCICEDPRALFFELHNQLANEEEYIRESRETVIGTGCNISALASIAKENVIIGNDVVIEEFVVVRPHTEIGDGAIIRAGSVIGGEGFEFKRSKEKIWGVKHLGGVKIGKEVEIQQNVCVDRGVYPWDNTEIGNYSKIDNLVHVAHGVKIQENVMIVAQSGIGGRTIIESGAWIGFGATVINCSKVGKDARVNMGAVATKEVKENGSVTGNFAIDHEKFIKNLKQMS